jgi:REP element-mobilizing transposase RayT
LIKTKHSNLPHIDVKDHYQFVTFRTKESIDSYLKKLYISTEREKLKQYKIDTYLDRSKNGAFLNGQIILDIQKYFRSYDKKMYDLIALIVMPNHIHILFKQKDELKNIMKILKGGSARIVNSLLNQEGQVWASDYFDKLIRDEKHFALVYE